MPGAQGLVTRNIAEDIGAILAGQGYGTVGTDIFFDHQPDTPNTCITVIDTNGMEDFHVPLFLYRVQLLIRATTKSVARTSAWSIYNFLRDDGQTLWPYTSGEVRLFAAIAQHVPAYLSWDVKRRTEYALNFSILARRKVYIPGEV